MDAKIVEKLDKKRYSLMLWKTVGFICFVGSMLLLTLVSGRFWTNFLSFTVGFGAALIIVMAIRQSLLMRKIRSSPEYHHALNNELVRHYAFKSVTWGFYAMLFAGVMLGMLAYYNETVVASTLCWGIVFCGLVAQMVSQLIYNRQ